MAEPSFSWSRSSMIVVTMDLGFHCDPDGDASQLAEEQALIDALNVIPIFRNNVA